MTQAEFSYPIAATDRKALKIEVDADARTRVAARLDLVQLDSFVITASIRTVDGGVSVTGGIAASLVQHCAATGLPVQAAIEEPFDLRFLVEAASGGAGTVDEEVELSQDECDILPLEGDMIDLGEAAVQTLSLALNPFPRHPDADRMLAEQGVLREDQAGPFAALAALRKG